ncbi:MAG: DinB family protein, partial [Candidatus Rokuibacteriota bacterium]
MPLPEPVEALWTELQSVRAAILVEAEGLSQGQADWKPSAKDWSVGEVVHHLILAEIATGKLTTKLTREAGAAGFPADLAAFKPFPAPPPGAAEAPEVVWPERGKPIAELLSTIRATRERSRQSIEKLASVDPRPLTFEHFRFGKLDLAQW